MKREAFFDVPRTAMSISTGEVELPILYSDVSNITFLFAVDYEKVENKTRKFVLKPGLRWGKQAVVALAFYEYRKTSIGTYNEVGLAIPVLMQRQRAPFSSWLDLYSNLDNRRTGIFIIDLPVTTKLACAAGCEIWGYPKFITNITFQLDNHSFSGRVMDPESKNPIVTVCGKLGWGIPGPPMSLLLLSQKRDRQILAKVNVRGAVRIRRKGGVRLQIGDSDHVMAQNLRDLGLDNSQPFLSFSTQRFQSRLNVGEEIFHKSA